MNYLLAAALVVCVAYVCLGFGFGFIGMGRMKAAGETDDRRVWAAFIIFMGLAWLPILIHAFVSTTLERARAPYDIAQETRIGRHIDVEA